MPGAFGTNASNLGVLGTNLSNSEELNLRVTVNAIERMRGGNDLVALCRLDLVLHRCLPSDLELRTRTTPFISQNVFIKKFQNVNSPTESSTYCLLVRIKISS